MHKLGIWIGSLWLFIQLASSAADRPNVILIMVDDLGMNVWRAMEDIVCNPAADSDGNCRSSV